MPIVNELFTATVRGMTSEGAGVVEHSGGQVFFVPGVWLGETAEFRVTGFKKRLGFARLVKLLEPSLDRIQPSCPHHGISPSHCGGCPWQFVRYDAQLQEKYSRVTRTLERLGVGGNQVAAIWPSPQQLGYRNRAQFKSDGRQLGYVSANTNSLVPISDCPILTDHNRQTLRQLLDSLPNPAFRPSKRERWTTIDIDEELSADQVQVGQRRPFRQANSSQNKRMKEWLAARLEAADKSLPVLELFAGSGNLTEVIAAAGFTNVVAVEGVAEAVTALDSLALANVAAMKVNLFDDQAVERLAKSHGDAGTLVLDPPRDGFKAIERLLTHTRTLRQILYVSCDLATLTRDLECIQRRGFTIVGVQPLDQFPHTPHIELLVHAVAAD